MSGKRPYGPIAGGHGQPARVSKRRHAPRLATHGLQRGTPQPPSDKRDRAAARWRRPCVGVNGGSVGYWLQAPGRGHESTTCGIGQRTKMEPKVAVDGLDQPTHHLNRHTKNSFRQLVKSKRQK